MANGSRFHIEINSIKVEDYTVRFNIFGDTLAEVTHDLESVIAYVTGQADIPFPAPPIQSVAPRVPQVVPPPVSAAAARSAALAAADALSAATKRPPAKAVGVCVKCGSDDLEWVAGTRKDNGKAFAAFRCQGCKAWQPEAK
jgi:hypothetical protein